MFSTVITVRYDIQSITVQIFHSTSFGVRVAIMRCNEFLECFQLYHVGFNAIRAISDWQSVLHATSHEFYIFLRKIIPLFFTGFF